MDRLHRLAPAGAVTLAQEIDKLIDYRHPGCGLRPADSAAVSRLQPRRSTMGLPAASAEYRGKRSGRCLRRLRRRPAIEPVPRADPAALGNSGRLNAMMQPGNQPARGRRRPAAYSLAAVAIAGQVARQSAAAHVTNVPARLLTTGFASLADGDHRLETLRNVYLSACCTCRKVHLGSPGIQRRAGSAIRAPARPDGTGSGGCEEEAPIVDVTTEV